MQPAAAQAGSLTGPCCSCCSQAARSLQGHVPMSQCCMGSQHNRLLPRHIQTNGIITPDPGQGRVFESGGQREGPGGTRNRARGGGPGTAGGAGRLDNRRHRWQHRHQLGNGAWGAGLAAGLHPPPLKKFNLLEAQLVLLVHMASAPFLVTCTCHPPAPPSRLRARWAAAASLRCPTTSRLKRRRRCRRWVSRAASRFAQWILLNLVFESINLLRPATCSNWQWGPAAST